MEFPDICDIISSTTDTLLSVGSRVAKFVPTHRECTVELSNDTSTYSLCNPRVHIDTGVCAEPLTPSIPPSSSGDGLFTKSRTSMRGTGGVFTYDLCENHVCKGKVAVLFKVPYDLNLRDVVFAVGFFDGDTECDKHLFHRMFKTEDDKFVRAKANGSCVIFETDFVTISSAMSNCGKPVMKVEVRAENKPGRVEP
uniref:Uncharacterized protein n=1 Tax=Periophthalmus magnuspinnatus TaxID=409849 RepID=A0A3B4A3J4_9GOBI